MNRIAIVAPLLALGACSSLSAMPTVPASDTARIEARIVSACVADGAFRPVVKAGVTIAVPVATVPLGILDAGIDIVCKNPERFANDIGTAEWVVKNIRDVLSKRAS